MWVVSAILCGFVFRQAEVRQEQLLLVFDQTHVPLSLTCLCSPADHESAAIDRVGDVYLCHQSTEHSVVDRDFCLVLVVRCVVDGKHLGLAESVVGDLKTVVDVG